MVIRNRLDRLQFTLRGAAFLRTLRMRAASCTGAALLLKVGKSGLKLKKIEIFCQYGLKQIEMG